MAGLRWRKKPVEIDAYLHDLCNEIPDWLAEASKDNRAAFLSDNTIAIHTLEGTMRAEVGDWIIRGVKGELYPCKPDIFAATYDPVDHLGVPS